MQRRSLHHGTGMVAQVVHSGTGVRQGVDMCCLLVGPAIPPTKSKYMEVEWDLAPAGCKRSETSQLLGFWEVSTFGGWDVNRICQKMLVCAGQVMPPNQWH